MGYAERLKLYISIHALLAESDAILGNPCAGCPAISIHALLAESDPLRQHQNLLLLLKFLSTLSLRRATNTGQPVRGLPSYFYPRSPCGERPLAVLLAIAHALQFLSTLSLRRATGLWQTQGLGP